MPQVISDEQQVRSRPEVDERCWRSVPSVLHCDTRGFRTVVSRVGDKIQIDAFAHNEWLYHRTTLGQVLSSTGSSAGPSEPAHAAQTCCMFLPGQIDVGNVQRIRTLVPLNHMHGSPSAVTLSPISRSPFLSGVVRECLPARGIRGGTALCPRYPIGVISRSA